MHTPSLALSLALTAALAIPVASFAAGSAATQSHDGLPDVLQVQIDHGQAKVVHELNPA